MTIEFFREQCLKIPELSTLWSALLREALTIQSFALPLALRTHQGQEISDEEHQKYHQQEKSFQEAVRDLANACRQHGVEIPDLRVADVCALVS